jgi:hypothetical protein
MEPHHAEGATIHQGHPDAIRGFQAHPLVTRGRVTHTGKRPIAGHPEVHLQQCPPAEGNELDFGSALNALNGAPGGRPLIGWGQMGLLCRMEWVEAGDDSARHGVS